MSGYLKRQLKEDDERFEGKFKVPEGFEEISFLKVVDLENDEMKRKNFLNLVI